MIKAIQAGRETAIYIGNKPSLKQTSSDVKNTCACTGFKFDYDKVGLNTDEESVFKSVFEPTWCLRPDIFSFFVAGGKRKPFTPGEENISLKM